MAQRKKPTRTKRKSTPKQTETDGQYLLKLVLVLLLGTFWLKFGEPIQMGTVLITAVPIGVIVGLGLISYFEHFQSDRKIWYAVLIIIGIISSFAPAGIAL